MRMDNHLFSLRYSDFTLDGPANFYNFKTSSLSPFMRLLYMGDGFGFRVKCTNTGRRLAAISKSNDPIHINTQP